jgi:hypothetical protein
MARRELLKVRLRLEGLEGRYAPAGLSGVCDDRPSAPLIAAEVRGPVNDSSPLPELGHAMPGPVRPLLAAVAAVGLCVAWDRHAARRRNHG